MSILDTVTAAWGWVGITPEKIIAENEFGNLIIKDLEGMYWRLCPEDLYCEVVADDDADYNELVKDEEFNQDWFMEVMVQKATEKFGPLEEGFKYHMLEPGALGGKYAVFNIKPIALERMIKFSGELAQKVHRAGDKKVKFTALV
jgi:hypothetical protein